MPDATSTDTVRKPTMPSSGGLMGRQFIYRTAEKTDVRLTWERAKAQAQGCPAPTKHCPAL